MWWLLFVFVTSIASVSASDCCDRYMLDSDTRNALEYYVRLMSIASCINKPCGLQEGSTEWNCADRASFPDMNLIKVWTCGDSRYEMTGYVSVDHSLRHVYFVVRGTTTSHDVLADLHVRMVPMLKGQCGRVHEGFYQSYAHSRLVTNEIVSDTMARYPQYKLVVLGHSLGGAIATLYACEWLSCTTISTQAQDILLITAGSPVIGDQKFADWVTTRLISDGEIMSGRNFFRITREGDVIPRIPFWQGYTPLAGEVYLQDSCNQTDCGGQPPPDAFYCTGNRDPSCIWGDEFPHNIEEAFYRHQDYFCQIGGSCKAAA